MSEFGQLIELEIPRLRRYAHALTRDRLLADDIVQDCLVRAVGKQHLWERGTDLRAWLFTLLHHSRVNHLRRVKREKDRAKTAAIVLTLVPRQPDDRLELRDLDRAIGNLPEYQRRVLLLVGLEGLDYARAGTILGLPVGTVRSRVGRARQALRKELSRPRPSPRQPFVADVAACRRTRGERAGGSA